MIKRDYVFYELERGEWGAGTYGLMMFVTSKNRFQQHPTLVSIRYRINSSLFAARRLAPTMRLPQNVSGGGPTLLFLGHPERRKTYASTVSVLFDANLHLDCVWQGLLVGLLGTNASCLALPLLETLGSLGFAAASVHFDFIITDNHLLCPQWRIVGLVVVLL